MGNVGTRNTYMGLAPGFNSSGELLLDQFLFNVSTISTASTTILSSQSGTWFYTTAANSTLSTITLPVPEAGAFYGFVIGADSATVGAYKWRTPSSTIDILVGGEKGSTNTAVQMQTSGADLGAVVGFLGLSATRYAFLTLSPEASTDFTSLVGSGVMVLWSAVDSTG